MASLLAMDFSKHCGFAYFKSGEAKPLCWTWHGSETWLSEEYGGLFSGFEKTLKEAIMVYKPEVIAFESPLLIANIPGRGTDEQQVRRLVGMAAIIEKVAYDAKLRCMEAHVQTVKSFIGIPGRRPQGMTPTVYKDLMVIAMTRRNFSVADSHQADAAGVGLCVYSDLEGEG